MKAHTSRLANIILALAAALALAACSTIKLGYSTLPEVGYWWLNAYVDFTPAQTPRVRDELGRPHAWHRQQELPRLAEMVARMERLAPGPVSPQQACGFVTEVQARLQAVANHAGPAAAALAAGLSPAQLGKLQEKFGEKNYKFRRDWVHVPVARQHDKRYEQMLDRFESLYGRLDKEQRQRLRQAVEDSLYDPQRILAERLRRQQDLLRTLENITAATPAEAPALLRGYVERVRHSPDKAYRSWQQDLLQENCRTFAAVHAGTTGKQREHAVQRLRGYQRELRELSGQH